MPPNWLTQAHDSVWWGIFFWSLALALGVIEASIVEERERCRRQTWHYFILKNFLWVLLVWQNTWMTLVVWIGRDHLALLLTAIILDLFFVIFIINWPTKIYLMIEGHFKEKFGIIQRGP